MLRVLSDALSAADSRQLTLLALLDMSAAFDCVDHVLLLQRLQRSFGLTGSVLQWMTSFLTGRTQQVTCMEQSATRDSGLLLTFDIPEGDQVSPFSSVIRLTWHRLLRWSADVCIELCNSKVPRNCVMAAL